MSRKDFNLSGIHADVMFGKRGGRLVHNSVDDVFEVFSTDGITRKNIRVSSSPVHNLDAVSYGFLKSILEGKDAKESVIAASTTNILLSSLVNGVVVDGIILLIGDRILLKDQTDQTENGIYIVGSSRSDDADDINITSIKELTKGATVYVESGLLNKETLWTVITSGSIGTDPIVFQNVIPTTATAPSGIIYSTTDISYTTSNGVLLTLPINAKLLSMSVNVTTSWDDIASSIEIGTSSIDDVLNIQDTDLNITANYEKIINTKYIPSQVVTLTIDSQTSTQGAATISFEYTI